MPTPRKSLFDHYLEAVRLLARADVNLEWCEDAIKEEPYKEIVASLRADINNYLKKKVPQS